MKIKNKSIKPICFGDVNILPGDTKVVSSSYKEAAELYVKLGYVEVESASGETSGKTSGKSSGKTSSKSSGKASDASAEDSSADPPSGEA